MNLTLVISAWWYLPTWPAFLIQNFHKKMIFDSVDRSSAVKNYSWFHDSGQSPPQSGQRPLKPWYLGSITTTALSHPHDWHWIFSYIIFYALGSVHTSVVVQLISGIFLIFIAMTSRSSSGESAWINAKISCLPIVISAFLISGNVFSSSKTCDSLPHSQFIIRYALVTVSVLSSWNVSDMISILEWFHVISACRIS